MHEMSLIRNVVDLAVKTCEENNAASVRKVRLAVGEFRDIVEELVPGLFERLTRGTVAEGAKIELVTVPATGRCRSCGCTMDIELADDASLTCGRCGAERDFTLLSGNEFMVLDIELVMASHEEAPAA